MVWGGGGEKAGTWSVPARVSVSQWLQKGSTDQRQAGECDGLATGAGAPHSQTCDCLAAVLTARTAAAAAALLHLQAPLESAPPRQRAAAVSVLARWLRSPQTAPPAALTPAYLIQASPCQPVLLCCLDGPWQRVPCAVEALCATPRAPRHPLCAPLCAPPCAPSAAPSHARTQTSTQLCRRPALPLPCCPAGRGPPHLPSAILPTCCPAGPGSPHQR